jgi:C-terminal processing protease CtpA/Prc
MKTLFAFFTVALALSSCEKIIFEPDLGSKNPMTNFDYLWNEIDKKYSYFELKNIDWDAIKNKYRSRLSDSSSEEELFSVLASMLNELKDDHTNLVSPFNISRYDIALQNPDNSYFRTIQKHYIPDVWVTESGMAHGFLDGNKIGYILYNSFLINFTDQEMDFILNRYKNTNGIILDLRGNGGGTLTNVPRLLARFIETKTLAAYTITRNGEKRNEFGAKQPFYLTPYKGLRYKKPIVVLTDRGSYSATTFFALATKALPHFILLGDTTGGGGGLPNGGQLPNGWTYRFSVSQLLDVNGNNYAEAGVPPNINVAFDWSDLTKDKILDRAILELQ